MAASTRSMPDPTLQPVRVWDLPTRLFHWVLALTIVGSVLSVKIGGNAMVWHMRFGFVVFTLLAFRLLWGLVGGRWSRFASFIYAPSTVLRYLRGQSRPGEHLDVGHNPLGSFSVFALLAILAVQVGTGLVADDEIANLGPLNRFVSNAAALSATSWHKWWGQWLILGLVALHIGAIVFYLLRRTTNLVRPMVVGDKPLPAGTPASADGLPQRLLGLVLLAVCAGVVSWVVRLGG
ncbi:MAG: cytochrome b/b6 domain-containing protein [Rubrivivax sp.]|nr:cytochrome b/b6 domain-containing protein [Rubrivivax sp.]